MSLLFEFISCNFLERNEADFRKSACKEFLMGSKYDTFQPRWHNNSVSHFLSYSPIFKLTLNIGLFFLFLKSAPPTRTGPKLCLENKFSPDLSQEELPFIFPRCSRMSGLFSLQWHFPPVGCGPLPFLRLYLHSSLLFSTTKLSPVPLYGFIGQFIPPGK